METSTFVYDGDCAFCTSCAQFIERRVPTGARVVPWQFADLAALGLTEAECEEAVQWVGAAGSRAAGPDAVARLLGDSGPLWRFAGAGLRLAPVRAAAWPAYRWVARNRHRMPGGTAACALPQEARERLYGPAGRPGPTA
ncbi:thiol-disulfide oxidoreductase DCC family protein [Micromonospora sp. NPDC005257]|uniref:thiol-disulfide oxidoreductase DCC family protein n=1 Tax=Micromonospora sp. NPDC005257 TaxID=3364230 RepID=UPI00369804CB